MKLILLPISFFLFMLRVQSNLNANMDYFVMTEAHISEYRANEDANAGYVPFYIECRRQPLKHSCQPAIPTLSANEGYVSIPQFYETYEIYYGCPQKIDLTDVLNPEGYFQKSLIMRAVKPKDSNSFVHSLNQYRYKCTTEVSPVIWRIGIGPITTLPQLYGIGFLVPGLKQMAVAEVYYDHEKNIPMWTKHTLYGVSLAAPIRAFKSIEDIVYEDDLEYYLATYLKTAIESYYKFNVNNSGTRKRVNDILTSHELEPIPDTSKIVLGHLIPEYDMIASNWKKVSQFAQTIVPTWEELYLNEWIIVEEMIREISFMQERTLTVFSGIFGQLTFNFQDKDQKQPTNKFQLGMKKGVVVPEMIWKLVIDYGSIPKKATVIMFRNLTKQMEELKIFTQFEPPCKSLCSQFQQNTEKRNQLIYCCTVSEVDGKIVGSPSDAIQGYFDVLIN